jgi:hypothetical protein
MSDSEAVLFVAVVAIMVALAVTAGCGSSADWPASASRNQKGRRGMATLKVNAASSNDAQLRTN